MDVSELDFNKMPVEEIHEVIARADAELERRRQIKITEVRNQIKSLAESVGMSPELLLVAKTARRQRDKLKPVREIRFRNTSNPAETWTGRGKRPRWLAQALANGASLETFRVN